jgi:SEC-C motif
VAFVTLIMVLANNDQAIILADRRTSQQRPITLPDGRTGLARHPVDEEYNKLTSFVCANARVGVGFTGVATTPSSFNTAEWLLGALMEAARPSPFLQPTVERLREIATRDICALPGEHRLTIVLAGYVHSDAAPLGCLCWVSNFEGLGAKRYGPVRPAFESYVITQDRPSPEPFYLMQVYGSIGALKNRASQVDGAAVRRLLEHRRPARAIRDKALAALNHVGAPRGELGGIGRQCGCIVVPSESSGPIATDYLSDENRWEVEFPSQVVVVGADTDGAVMGLRFRAEDPSQAAPLAVRKVPRNHTCPCGSGAKYKRCHGRVFPPVRS